MTKMTYGLRVIDLSEKYFGDLVPEDRMCIKIKPKKNETIERILNPLRDLSNTYFTVEQIKYESKSNTVGTEKELFEEMALQDKKLLKPIEQIIKKITKNTCKVNKNCV